VVVSTVPDTPTTRGIFDARRLQLFKRGSIFINFGRGSVVDENALINRLCDKHLGGAVIDVTQSEPLSKNHGLWNCPNTIITQHTGGGTIDEEPRKIEWFCNNLKRFRQGETLLGAVDFKRGY
jgi:phosphoglycerate dehydrogenase-like enzyme